MILLLDAGNTRAKFGWLDRATGERERHVHALEYEQIDTLEPWLESLQRRPTRILGVNVAGARASKPIEALFARLYDLHVDWVDGTHGQAYLRNGYEQPNQLGADRWAAMLGLLRRVRHEHAWHAGQPMLLASFGTACTLDTLANRSDEQGVRHAHFVGGLILPGPVLMTRSLSNGTAQLPYVQGEPVDYPTTTHGAISSGIAAAQAGALLRQWRTAFAHFQMPPRVFVSGGGWPLVQSEVCRTLARAQADLALRDESPHYLASPVLDGLAWLAG